ncbi:hypothetical protein D3C75_495750 [compost metagenome]
MSEFKKDDIVVIKSSDLSGHFFDIGTHVRIANDLVDHDGQLEAWFLDGSDYWFVDPLEIELVEVR